MARLFNDAANDETHVDQAVVSGIPFAVSIWAKRDADIECIPFSLVDKDAASHSFAIQLLNSGVGNIVKAFARDAGGYGYATTSTGTTDNAWQHICALFVSDTDRRVLLNAGGRGTGADDITPLNMDRVSIGVWSRNPALQYFSGDIAEVAIWDLSSWAGATDSDKADNFERILASIVAGYSAQCFPLGLKAYWPLIRGLKDKIGGYNLTASGTVVSSHPRIIQPFQMPISKSSSISYTATPSTLAVEATLQVPAVYSTGERVGSDTLPANRDGATTANNTYIFDEAYYGIGGFITAIDIYVNDASGGVLDFAVFRNVSGNNFSDDHAILGLSISNGLNQFSHANGDFDGNDLPIELGEYIGFYVTDAGRIDRWEAAGPGPGYRYDAGDQISGAPNTTTFVTSLNVGDEIQIRVFIEALPPVLAPVLAGEATLHAPAIVSDCLITPATLAAEATLQTPVTIHILYPGSFSALATIHAPTIVIDCTVIPATIVTEATLHAPLAAGFITVTPVTLAIEATLHQPTVSVFYITIPPFILASLLDPYSGEAWLWLAEIVVPGYDVVRVARNTANVMYGTDLFSKGNFGIDKQSLSGDGTIPRLAFYVSHDELHNLEAIMNASKGMENGYVKLIRTCEKFLETPVQNFEALYSILMAGSDNERIAFSLGIPNPLTQKIPRDLYSYTVCPLATPSLFKGVYCRYTGSDTVCTGLLEDCYTKGNTQHWGAEVGLDPSSIRV